MKNVLLMALAVVIIIETVTAFTVYRWDAESKTWKPTENASMTAEGAFESSADGEVIPIEFFSNGKRIRFNLNVNISSVKVRLATLPITSHVFGKWTVDNMYVLLNSTNDLQVSYSIEGSKEGYYLSTVDEDTPPPPDVEKWKKIGKGVKTDKLSVSSGNHEFYLWLGFDKSEDTIFVGPIIFDTYVVPDI